MTAIEKLRAREAELREQIKVAGERRSALLDVAITESRNLTEAETEARTEATAAIEDAAAQVKLVTERIAQLAEQESRDAAEAATRKAAGETGEQRAEGGAAVTDPPVYRRDNTGRSYFLDLFRARHKQDVEAADRLRRNDKQTAAELEKRALGNTNAVGGAGGEFAPPLWLVDQYVKLARPGRVAVDLFTKAELPAGVSSINVPRVATGTTTAIQTTQNTALSQTDLTTNALSANVVTIGGKAVVSLQLLEQSAIPFDEVILQDLALAYAGAIDVQGLTGAGTSGTLRGLGSAAGLTLQAYTDAAPAVAGAGKFYAQVHKANAAVNSTRFLPADTVLMHPRRWSWIAASFDASNRPLVVPNGAAYNPVGNAAEMVSQGYVGDFAGLQVFADPNLPVNLGAGANQDVVYVFRRGDVRLWESSPRIESFEQPYADTAGVLFRFLAYSAMIPDRYGSSIVQIGGTGLVTPAF